MDKIEKALKKLGPAEREQIKKILLQLRSGHLKGLDIKKLKGRNDIFRTRKGNLRILYQFHNNQIFILALERRSEKIYKKF